MAAPFVDGTLWTRGLKAIIDSECAHCREPIRVEVTSGLEARVLGEGATPLVSTPFVDLMNLGPSIIDGF